MRVDSLLGSAKEASGSWTTGPRPDSHYSQRELERSLLHPETHCIARIYHARLCAVPTREVPPGGATPMTNRAPSILLDRIRQPASSLRIRLSLQPQITMSRGSKDRRLEGGALRPRSRSRRTMGTIRTANTNRGALNVQREWHLMRLPPCGQRRRQLSPKATRMRSSFVQTRGLRASSSPSPRSRDLRKQ